MTPTVTTEIHRRITPIGLVSALLLASLSIQLHCQSIDYGVLQQLFQEPVTTSVDGSPRRASDAPASMEIITADDIRRSGAKDIPGVLRHVAGIDVLRWSDSDADVGVRGYDQAFSPRLLLLVDGRQVYADHYGYTPWSTLPVELIEIRQIEIIKGPNSALYGFNAVSGVINIVTFNPLYDDVNAISLSGGTQNSATGSAVGTYRWRNRTAIRVAMGGRSSEDFTTPVPELESAGPRQEDNYSRTDVNAVARLRQNVYIGVEATHSAAHLNEMDPSYVLQKVRYGTESVKGQLTQEGRRALFQATVYTNWLRTRNSPGVLGQPLYFTNRVTVAQVQDIFRLGANHTLRAAVEYRNNTESTTPFTGARVYDNLFAVSGMWRWKIASSLEFTNAVRVDNLWLGRTGPIPQTYLFSNADWNRTYTVPSFNSGAVWRPNDRNAIRFMIARGVEFPSLAGEGAFVETTPFGLTLSGSPEAKPSVVTNYEVGWDHVIGSPRTSLRASAFHQHNEDLLSIDAQSVITPQGAYSLTGNMGDSDANGVELGLHGTLSESYRWGINYRSERITDHLPPETQNGVAYLDYEHTTPLNLVKANVGWALKQWEIDSYLQFQSATHGLVPTGNGTMLIPIAPYVSVDSRVGYDLSDRMTWSVSGQNLTQATQHQTSGPGVQRSVFGTISIHF